MSELKHIEVPDSAVPYRVRLSGMDVLFQCRYCGKKFPGPMVEESHKSWQGATRCPNPNCGTSASWEFGGKKEQ